jgi:methylmalonyl-CoA epimerase
MDNISLPIDHIGIAVSDIDQGLILYKNCAGLKLTHREILKSENIEVAFLEGAGPTIELISTKEINSPLGKFLAKRGPGLHHICFRSTDIKLELSRLSALGFTLIDQTPRLGSRGKQIAFIHPKSTAGTLIEICQ